MSIFFFQISQFIYFKHQHIMRSNCTLCSNGGICFTRALKSVLHKQAKDKANISLTYLIVKSSLSTLGGVVIIVYRNVCI